MWFFAKELIKVVTKKWGVFYVTNQPAEPELSNLALL